MKISFIGQAGFIIEENNYLILIDPYLSDNVAKYQPQNHRRCPIKEELFSLKPNLILITHCHLDHYDVETLKRFLTEDSSVTVLCPSSVYSKIISFGGKNKYIEFNVGSKTQINDFNFVGIKAMHTDSFSIGFAISKNGENYLFTGDTVFDESIVKTIPKMHYKYVCLPINGVGNNMDVFEAKKYLSYLDFDYAIPCHFGMFDNMTGDELDIENKIIPKIYEEVK